MANGKKPIKGIQIGPDVKKVAKLFVDPFGVGEQVYEMGKKFYSPVTSLFQKYNKPTASSAIKAAAKGAIEKSSQPLKNPATPSSGSGTVYIGKPRPNITPKTGVTKMTAIPIKGEIEALPKQNADPHPINKKMEEFVSNQRQSKPKGMSEMEWMENKNL